LSKKNLARNIFSLGIMQAANYVFPLITVPVISRIIGPEKFGIINFADAVIMYFSLLINYGFDYSATRKIARDPDNAENRSSVFNEVFTSKCLLFVLSVAGFMTLLFTIPQLKQEKEVALFSFIVCLSAVFTQNWLFQGMQDLPKIAVLNFVAKLLFTIMILWVVRKKEDYLWQPLVSGIAYLSVSVFAFFWAVKKYNIKLSLVPVKKCLEVLRSEKTVFFSLVVISLYTTTNTVILGLYQSSEQVGYYTAGQKLIVIIQSVIAMPLAQALYPYIGRSFGESFETGLGQTRKLLPFVMALTGITGLLMIVAGPHFLTLFYGKAFSPSVPVFQILAFIPMIVGMSNIFGMQIMLNLKMDKTFFKITASGALLSILLNLVMVRYWGYIGSALNWLLTEIFITTTMYITLVKKGIQPFSTQYFRAGYITQWIKLILSKFQINRG
jgi:PST family polysaccharide transporter